MKKLILLITILFVVCFASSSLAALEAPVLSSSTDGLDITLDWTSVPDATGYTLYYVPVASYTGPESISSIDLRASTTFNYTLWEGASFYLAVKAYNYNNQESSPYSNIGVLNIEAAPTPPMAPELSVTKSDLNLSLSWETVPAATGYILSYALTSSYSDPASFITKDVGGDTSFQAVLWDGAAFTVAVKAYNEDGESGYSNIETFTLRDPQDGGKGYTETSCVSTVDDSKQNPDGSASRIASHNNGNPTYDRVSTRRTADNTVVYMDYLVHEPAVAPKALLVLILGGNHNASITGDVDTGIPTMSGWNFLVRSAHLFARQGYRVVTIDRPTDFADWTEDGISSSVDFYRVSIKHAVDLSAVINKVNAVDNSPIVILGTSRGAISAVNQHFLAEAISLSSPVTSGLEFPVGSGNHLPAEISMPTQIMWNKLDRCSVTKPADSESLLYDFPNVVGNELEGGFFDSVVNRPCNAMDYHGFGGIESCAAETTTSWVDSLVFDATRPVAAVELSRRYSPINSGETVDIDLSSVVTAASDGALSFSLPYDTTTLGGTVFITGSTVTYTPATGVSGTRDTFVYVVSEAGGGKAHNRVVVQIN